MRSALDPPLAAAAFCHFAAVAGGIGIELGSENGEWLAMRCSVDAEISSSHLIRRWREADSNSQSRYMDHTCETILVAWPAFAFRPERPTPPQGGTGGSNLTCSSEESRKPSVPRRVVRPEAALLRFDNLHIRRPASPHRRSRRESDSYGHRLSVSLDQDRSRPHPEHPRIKRC